MKVYKDNGRNGPSTLQTILGGLGIVGGVWLILAPFVLNYDGITKVDPTTRKTVPIDLTAVTTSDIICGVVLLALVGFMGLAARTDLMANFKYYAYMAVISLGIYLMAAPYIFDLLKVTQYMNIDKPNTNDMLVGLLAVIIGGFALQQESNAGPASKDNEDYHGAMAS